MKKHKIISTIACLGGLLSVVTPIAMMTSCSNGGQKEEIKVIPTEKLLISDGTLSGVAKDVDLSTYNKLEIPKGVVKIAPGAFKNVFTAGHYDQGVNNNVKELVIPTGLRYIGANAFEGCTGIEKLNLEALDDNDINFLMFPSELNGGNDSFKEWKNKGTITYSSKTTEAKRKEFNDKLILNGLGKYWVNNEGAPNTSETHILSINDFHGAAPGFGDDFFNTNQLNAGAIRLAQETQETISKYPGSTFLSCGDYNAGESFSTCKQAETLYPVVKAMNIQYSAVGNHAWEWGKENLENEHWDQVARTNDTKGKYFVNANVLNDEQYRSKQWSVDESSAQFEQDYSLWNTQRIKWADPYKILDMNGHNVCIIGLTTHDTLTDGNLNAIAKLTFMKDYNASVVYAKHLAKQELKDDYNKIESFILLTHCACQPIGTDEHTVDPNGECAQLAKNATTDFDAILAAHSHRMCVGKIKNDKTNKQIYIGQAGQSGRYYMDTKLEFDDSKEVGKRLTNVSMELKTPKIEGQDLSMPVSKRKPDAKKGRQQMENIVNNTIYPIVKNTAKVYAEQKEISKAELNVSVGTLSNKGLPYYYTDHTERSFGTQYMESPTLVEPATIFAQRGLINEFNEEYKPQIEAKQILPASISFNNLDSFKNGFNLKEGQTSREVIKNEVFSQNAFENSTYYGCLTKGQLIQYINYFLEGAGEDHFNYEPKVKYVPFGTDKKIWLDDGKTTEMVFNANETVVEDKTSTVLVPGTSYSCGPVQFYGLSFTVKQVDERTDTGSTFKVYQLDEEKEIRIYLPGENDFLKPETWTLIDDYVAKTDGYIPVIMSSFTWQGGNAQNRMLNHWFEYNESVEKTERPEVYERIKHRMFSLLTRDAIIRYAVRLKANQIPMDQGIDADFIKTMIKGIEE